jgi:guanylate kinase
MEAYMKRTKGVLYVVSAPSGAGKTTLAQMLMGRHPEIRFSVSYTTRPPREGEVEGMDYSFVTKDEFMSMVDRGEFAEWAEVHGNCYGTSKVRLQEMLEAGNAVLLDIDVQGARQMRDSFPGGVYIFVLPPSKEVLRERLTGRGSDSPEVIRKRLENASDEIRDFIYYDYVIVNDSLDEAYRELEAVVVSARLRRESLDSEWVRREFLS